MKHTSFLRRLTAAVLSCTLCCTGMTFPVFSADDTAELPARFDWREEAPEILTPVKTQIGGTCWAYSAIGCAESNLILKGYTDSSIDLSETHLIWFTRGQESPTDPADPRYGGGHNNGIDGYTVDGSLSTPVFAFASWQGVVNESDYPAHSEKQPLDESERYHSVAHLQNTERYDPSEHQTIKTKLMNNGPLVSYYFSSNEDELSEKHGYYNSDYLEMKEKDALDGSGHFVMAVGWDDNFPKENFTDKPPGDGAWIIRNSWGNNANSEDGYFYMSYYEPSILLFYYYDFEPVTNYKSVHSYNNSDTTRIYASSDTTGLIAANIFEATEQETIAAVGFMSNQPSQAYEISVYAMDSDDTIPTEGELVSRESGILEYGGFHTIRLSQSYAVEKGQKYAVTVKYPIGEKYAVYMDTYSYAKGVSFFAVYDSNGIRKWGDCYDKNYGDACIYVYTEYEDESDPFTRGDMDRNGRLTAADLSLMKQAIREPVRSDLYQPAADWNGDNEINAEDAHGLLNYLLTASEQEG